MFRKKGVGTSLDYIKTARPPNLTRLLHNTASYAGYGGSKHIEMRSFSSFLNLDRQSDN